MHPDEKPGGKISPTRNEDGTFVKGEAKEKEFAAETAEVSGMSKAIRQMELARVEHSTVLGELNKINGVAPCAAISNSRNHGI